MPQKHAKNTKNPIFTGVFSTHAKNCLDRRMVERTGKSSEGNGDRERCLESLMMRGECWKERREVGGKHFKRLSWSAGCGWIKVMREVTVTAQMGRWWMSRVHVVGDAAELLLTETANGRITVQLMSWINKSYKNLTEQTSDSHFLMSKFVGSNMHLACN